MSIRVIKLSRKEMARLPFPFTAKRLGGLWVIQDDSIDQSQIDKIRKQFKESIKNLEFKTPTIIKDGKDE